MAVGTVAYAAPEQLMGEHMDGRADQYALAATAFHLLTGTPVFQHSNPAVVISQHLNTPPPSIGTRRPDLRDLGPVFSKALAKAPEDRYFKCVEFADALAKQLGIVAAETGAAEATAPAIPVSAPRHRVRTTATIRRAYEDAMENHGRAAADHDGLRAGPVGPALNLTALPPPLTPDTIPNTLVPESNPPPENPPASADQQPPSVNLESACSNPEWRNASGAEGDRLCGAPNPYR